MKRIVLVSWGVSCLWLLASCSSGPKVNLDPGSRAFYETAQLNMTPAEKDIFNHLADVEARIPAEAFNFKQQAGTLRADLAFQVFVSAKNGPKVKKFKDRKEFAQPEGQAVELKEAVISLPHDFAPGIYYPDAIIENSDGTLGKTRKIFEVRVNP